MYIYMDILYIYPKYTHLTHPDSPPFSPHCCCYCPNTHKPISANRVNSLQNLAKLIE